MNTYGKLLPICLVSLLSLGCDKSASQGDGDVADADPKEIKTAAELKKFLEDKNVILVHSFDAGNYAEGHIEGAVNIDIEKMTEDSLPKDKTRSMVFYCAGGMCPVGWMAGVKAAELGYTHVWVYSGGMQDWQRAGNKFVKGAASKKSVSP